jgi:hypothetical protein
MTQDDFGPHVDEGAEVFSPVIGCYSMHLYCQNVNSVNHSYNEFPVELIGKSKQDCKKQGRKLGWIFHRNNYATCPKCSKKEN